MAHRGTSPPAVRYSLFAVLLVFASCSSAPARVELQGVRRAVVFPFENLSGQPNDAGRRMTSVFASYLYRNAGIEVVEQGEIERFIAEERIRGVDALTSDVQRLLGTRFGAQLVVVGQVNEFGFVPVSGEQVPIVGLHVRLVNPRNGRLLWSCTRSLEGTDGETVFGIGKVRSISRLSEMVVEEICGEMADAAAEIARLLERKDAPEIEPISRPDNEGPKPEAGVDEEREEVRRAVKRHWELIKESREK